MESNLTYFSLPFVDTPEIEYSRIKGECGYEELHPGLLGTDDVLAQFLPGDEPLEEPDLNGPTTLHCEICKKQFDNAKKYYGHLRVHSKYNLWTCDKCPNERFSTKQQLMKHTLIHKPLERVWKCTQCGMSFEALWRLQQHLFAKHLGYSPHKCDVCEKSFHKLSDLKKHKTVHEDVRIHKCTECEARFKDKTNLKRHMLTHDDFRQFECKGCHKRYKQSASLKRHRANCAKFQKLNETLVKENKTNTIIYLEQSIRPQYIEQPKENQLQNTNCTVDKIVDDILSAEDDYVTIPQQNILNYQETDNLQIELLKDMHIDDELLYNDIDLDTLQNMCNNIDCDKNMFDMNDGRIEQDIMNELYQKEGMNDILNTDMLNKDFLESDVNENECATIFETDIDLEASTNLTANLNQLIGENNVQYISTENDDTFIISLNSEIDAEQLTDMLNIGTNLPDDNPPDNNKADYAITDVANADEVSTEPIILKIEKPAEVKSGDNENCTKNNKKSVKVKKTLYICRKCRKIFNKKETYWSHRATHEPELSIHKCGVCQMKFGYKTTLKRHMLKYHIPFVLPAHSCSTCNKTYNNVNHLKRHIRRSHQTDLPYVCKEKGCNKKYSLKSDLDIHSRSHSQVRPYSCKNCNKTFRYSTHYSRHAKQGCRNK